MTLLGSEIPVHSHSVVAQATPLGGAVDPTNKSFNRPASGNLYSTSTANIVAMSNSAIAPAGGNQPHNNLQPYLTLNFCIALQGVYPPRA